MKKKLLKKIYLLSALFLISLTALAGGEKLRNGNWNRLSVNSLAVVNYKYVNCELPSQGTNQEIVYLQFKNLTKKTIIVSYDLELYYNDKCISCDENAEGRHFSIELQPGKSLEGMCDPSNNPGLKIFSKMLNRTTSSVLTNFEISNFNVKIK